MNSEPPFNSPAPTELEPWVIVTQSGPDEATSQLAVWRLAGEHAQSALALFSDRQAAEHYAQQFCSAATELVAASVSYRVEQFTSLQLVAVLAECYRLGMRCAALNPSGDSAQQLFILRDVLLAAKLQLRSAGGLG